MKHLHCYCNSVNLTKQIIKVLTTYASKFTSTSNIKYNGISSSLYVEMFLLSEAAS